MARLVRGGASRSAIRASVNELYDGLGNGINAQTGTSYTLALTDAGKDIKHTNAGATNITVSPAASVAWVTGTTINIWNLGAGLITLVAGAAVTINKPASKTLVLKEQGSVVSLKYWGSNVWNVIGDLTDA